MFSYLKLALMPTQFQLDELCEDVIKLSLMTMKMEMWHSKKEGHLMGLLEVT